MMHKRTLRRRGLVPVAKTIGLSLLLWTAASAKVSSQVDTAAARPRLTIVMFVDQMRADYLTRWAPLYKGGLRRLSTMGTVFTHARHDHAITQTAVGHATIATGTIPARHGITGNSYYDRAIGKVISASSDEETQLMGGVQGTGSSSKRLLRPAMGDWIKAQSAGSKVYAASLKDRAAVFPGGLAPNGVFWYDDSTGNFVSSTYYTNELPAWVSAFNHSGAKDTWRDSIWSKTDSALAYQGDDGVLVESDGIHNVFPHSIEDSSATPNANYYEAVYETPFCDALLLKFGTELILQEQLGIDSTPDVLFISLSSADLVGHAFGPDSHEIEDYYLRLDKYLVPFFRMLDANVGQGKYLFVLTSDHGVCPLPEAEAARGNSSARRLRTDAYRADVRKAVARAFPNCEKPESLISFVGSNICLNEPHVAACSLSMQVTRQRIASAVQNLSYVAEVFTYDQLASDRFDGRASEQQFRNSFHRDRSPDLLVGFLEWVLVIGSAFGTTHGSPYHYDSDIPLVFYGMGLESEIYEEPVRSVDIAPTIVQLMGFVPPPDLDGQVLRIAR